MKRTITFTAGIVIFAAASAIGKSDQPNANAEAVTAEAAEFGQLSVENLTAEQRALLQSKFRYWTSSGAIAPKAPI
jgi:hypothetical protein